MSKTQIHLRPASEFNSLYREICTSAAGRTLALTIDLNVEAMRRISDVGRPALAVLLPLLEDEMIEALEDDRLMTAFGHMAKLKLELDGYIEVSRSDVRWPFTDRTSRCAIFQSPLKQQ